MLTIEKIVFLKANGVTSCFVAECENCTHSTHSQFHWSHSIYTTTGYTQHTHTATDQIQPTLPLGDTQHRLPLLKLSTLTLSLISLAKWLGVRLRTKWLWVRIPLQSVKLRISRFFRVMSSLTFRQL